MATEFFHQLTAKFNGKLPHMKPIATFAATVYVGGREGYGGSYYTRGRLTKTIADYQRQAPEDERGCVTVTETRYQFIDYEEDGYAIGIINYPRFPLSPHKLTKFAITLGLHLLAELKQNRVSIVLPEKTVLIERADAEEAPKREAA